jgi:hypothetical protein
MEHIIQLNTFEDVGIDPSANFTVYKFCFHLVYSKQGVRQGQLLGMMVCILRDISRTLGILNSRYNAFFGFGPPFPYFLVQH